MLSNSVTVGPILLGVAKPAHVLTSSATVRRVVNMTAIAVVDAQRLDRDKAGENVARGGVG
jgi:malate dehydrogenase (oxaloacetate-decarboxylating)(NADP+)